MSSSHHALSAAHLTETPQPTAPVIQSVTNALHLLETLADAQARTLSDLARLTGFTVNQTFRLLATLEGAGYVVREANKCYRLGPKLHLLGQHAAWPHDLIAAAAPQLDELSNLSGETILLSVRVGAERMVVDSRESQHSLRVSYPVGSRVPLYVGGMGVVMLAFSAPEVVEQVLEASKIPFTPLTLIDNHALQVELERVRQGGVRVSRDDYTQGEFSVAAPILDRAGTLRGALTIAGFTARLGEEAEARFTEAVRRAAKETGEVL